MIEKQCLMGIDLGTTTIKVGVFDVCGRCLGFGHGEYPIESPYPGWVEHDQNLWWSEIIRTMKRALFEAKISSYNVVGIGVTGQGHAISPLTRDGKVLAKCISAQDQRAIDQRRRIGEIIGIGDESEALVSSKILWLKENRPEIFRKTYKFLFASSYIVFKLTGEFSTDSNNAGNPDTFDFVKGDWSDSLLQALGIPRKKLPEVYKPWDVVGSVTEKAAEETGLKEGTPVIAGAMDAACCLYGSGFVKPGRCVDVTGTVGYWNVAVASKTPKPSIFNILPGIESVSGGISRTAGGTYRWFKDQFCKMELEVAGRTGVSEYQLMDYEADRVEPGSGGVFVLPHFVGRGMSLSMSRSGLIFGLTWTTSREQIIRAIMEGWAYEMRRGMEEGPIGGRGIKIEEARAVGGGGRSRIWRQIKADILGIPFSRINIDEVGCFGVAVLAGVGIGLFKDLISPIEEMVKVVERNEPRGEYRERYDEFFKIYLKLNTAMEHTGVYSRYFEVLEKQANLNDH
jgi:xylulokinase